MDSINFVSNLKVGIADSYTGLVREIFGSDLFYCYDVSKNAFMPIKLIVESRINHKYISISPYEEDKVFYLTHAFLVLPAFLYRNMLFSINTDLKLKLLRSDMQIKELQFSIDEIFKLNDRLGYNVAKILSKRDPDYSYIINNISKLKRELLGALHYLISLSCAQQHKGKLEEEIKDKIENNII